MIKLNGVEITPTRFPDGTGQVWKLDLNGLKYKINTVEWIYEDDSELTMVAQLGLLLNNEAAIAPHLSIPFLPYGRQDKEVSNNTTFGLKSFLVLLHSISNAFGGIETIDAHNPHSLPDFIKNIIPHAILQDKISKVDPDLICFPDKGASQRGYDISKPGFNLSKKRNQSTGEIEGLELELPLNLVGKKILIVDDICDGGRTFIEAAKLLYKEGASEVNLYTTHGIYSKGIGVLREAGIKRIFNYTGEV